MREGPATIVRRLLDHVKRGQPWSCTFIHEIPKEHEKVVEAQLKERFEIWANSWIIPDLKILLAKFEKRKKGGTHAETERGDRAGTVENES